MLTGLKRLPVLSMLVLLGGCPSLSQTGSEGIRAGAATASEFCLVAGGPIFWSQRDTPETIEAVKRYNAKGKSLCNWK